MGETEGEIENKSDTGNDQGWYKVSNLSIRVSTGCPYLKKAAQDEQVWETGWAWSAYMP